MKKLLTTVALALSTLGVSAQHAVGTWTIQPKVGLNVATLSSSAFDIRNGAVFGVEFEKQMNKVISLSFGAHYSMQGGTMDAGVSDSDATFKLDYINVPILANFYVLKNFALKIGVQPGFNVTHKINAEMSGVGVEEDVDRVKNLDISIPVGLSYEFKNFVLDARYNIGMVDIFRDELGGLTKMPTSKNVVLQFTLGYRFDCKM